MSISNDDIIVGRKSSSEMEQGYIYAPYIMKADTWLDISNDVLLDDLKVKIKRLKRNKKINDLLDE